MSLKDNITALFEPKTVAIIGASSVPGKVGYKVLANMAQLCRSLEEASPAPNKKHPGD